jgi:CubicO group peptidase (beta-lactamase class C family)
MKSHAFLLTSLFVGIASAQNPSQQWLRYKTPEQAGWSSEQLTTICRNSNANSVLIVQNGKVVFAYGEYWRRMKCHSMRKSFHSALYGIYIERGKIDTGKTIARLGIGNTPPLTDSEKQARVADLLKCRSGVYLPSGQETEDMVRSRPLRGSHPPDTYWYYNNWDFNALGTIFRKVTGRDIFESFRSDIANPLQMEDFRLMDGVYDFETPDTSHPGYMFKMSARDAARFGQLYLQNGSWNGKQIVPAKWVERSTTSRSATTISGTTYGYLWWTVEDFHGVTMYYAAGYGGQRIYVIPSRNLVVVLNSDTYSGNSVYDVDYVLPGLVFASRTGEEAAHPEFVPLEEPIPLRTTTLSKEVQRRYVGKYTVDDTPVTISQTDGGLILSGYHYSYKFRLLPLSRGLFHVEDIDLLLYCGLDNRGFPTKLEVHKSEATRDLHRLIMERGMEAASKEFPALHRRLQHKEELEFLCDQLAKKGVPIVALRELNAACFPYSYKAQSELKNELLKTGDLNTAAQVFRRLLDSVQARKLTKTKTEWYATILTALTSEAPLTKEQALGIAGDYGYRHVVAEEGTLYYHTGNIARKRKLYKISDKRFAIDGTYNMYIEFGQNESGVVNRIIGRYYRDSFDETFRTK